MTMRTVMVFQMVCLLGGISAAAAQDAGAGRDVVVFHSSQMDAVGAAAFTFESPIGMLSVEPFEAAEPVTDAPYTADIVTEIVQALADGNRIERRSTTSVARDGEGRVRREQQIAAIGPILPQGDVRVVTITDPVARVHFSLDAARRIAMRSALPRLMQRIDAASGPAPGSFVTATRVAGDTRSAVVAAARVAGDTRTEPLGTRDIGGVTAEGSRTVVTIPADTIGNLAPIEIVSERWYSPELRTVVLSRRSDPRFGETTYRLENIVRVEPSPELFRVPPDYTLEEARPFPGVFGGPNMPRP